MIGRGELMRELKHRELIAKWYDCYSLPLYKYIIKIVKDVYQAEDLMQETFIKAYEYIAQDKKVTYPKTFLYRIAYHLTIDYLRKKAPIHMIKDFFLNKKDQRPSIEHMIEVNEDVKELYQTLDQLKSSYRHVIILRKIEEFSIKETAQILNWSESKVKSTLFRALPALEKKLIKGGFMNETL